MYLLHIFLFQFQSSPDDKSSCSKMGTVYGVLAWIVNPSIQIRNVQFRRQSKKVNVKICLMCLMSSWICSRSPGSCDSRRIRWLGPGSWHRADCVILRGYSSNSLWKIHKVRPAGQTSEQFHRKFQGDSTCRSVAFKHISILTKRKHWACSRSVWRRWWRVLAHALAMHEVKHREREREVWRFETTFTEHSTPVLRCIATTPLAQAQSRQASGQSMRPYKTPSCRAWRNSPQTIADSSVSTLRLQLQHNNMSWSFRESAGQKMGNDWITNTFLKI